MKYTILTISLLAAFGMQQAHANQYNNGTCSLLEKNLVVQSSLICLLNQNTNNNWQLNSALKKSTALQVTYLYDKKNNKDLLKKLLPNNRTYHSFHKKGHR